MNVMKDLADAEASGMSREDAERSVIIRATTLAYIQRHWTCPVSGEVLDIRTAVALVGGPDGDDVYAVVSPASWSTFKDHLRDKLGKAGKDITTAWVNGKVRED